MGRLLLVFVTLFLHPFLILLALGYTRLHWRLPRFLTLTLHLSPVILSEKL